MADCVLAAGAMAVATPPACGAPQLGQNPTLSATVVPHLVQCGTKFLPRIWRPSVAFEAERNKCSVRRQVQSAVPVVNADCKSWRRLKYTNVPLSIANSLGTRHERQ